MIQIQASANFFSLGSPPEAQHVSEAQMKIFLSAILAALVLLAVMYACSDAPKGQWKVTAPIDVYADNDDVAPIAFVLKPGEICAIADGWSYQKMFRFKRVACGELNGWVSFDDDFENMSDAH